MDARQLEWGDLQIFLATARAGTLSAAAAQLRVDSSTVQRRVGKLETTLKTRLFDRSQRGYSLTAAGQDLLRHVDGMDEQAIAAQRVVTARDAANEGSVRLATVDDIAVVILPPILRAFRDQYPRVTVSVDVRTSFADLTKHQADIALRIAWRNPRQPNIVAKRISPVDAALYASASYLKTQGRPARLEELRQHAVVRGDEDMSQTPPERFLERHVDPSKVAFRSNSFFARLAAIKHGMGVGLLGCYMGERENGLERLPFRFPQLSAYLWLLLHVDLRQNARVRAFVHHLEAALRAQEPPFEAPNERKR